MEHSCTGDPDEDDPDQRARRAGDSGDRRERVCVGRNELLHRVPGADCGEEAGRHNQQNWHHPVWVVCALCEEPVWISQVSHAPSYVPC